MLNEAREDILEKAKKRHDLREERRRREDGWMLKGKDRGLSKWDRER